METEESKLEAQKEQLDISVVMCSFSQKELEILSEALTYLHHSKVEYLSWKKDEYSQRGLPGQIKEVVEMLLKVDKLRNKIMQTVVYYYLKNKQKQYRTFDTRADAIQFINMLNDLVDCEACGIENN